MGVAEDFTGVFMLMLLGAIVGAAPWCCIKIARLLLEKDGVGTSATIAACASSLITSLIDKAKNVDDSALRATEGCKHVAISVQKASERDKCSCLAAGKSAARRACSSVTERVRVRFTGAGGSPSSVLRWYTSSTTFVTSPWSPTKWQTRSRRPEISCVRS